MNDWHHLVMQLPVSSRPAVKSHARPSLDRSRSFVRLILALLLSGWRCVFIKYSSCVMSDVMRAIYLFRVRNDSREYRNITKKTHWRWLTNLHRLNVEVAGARQSLCLQPIGLLQVFSLAFSLSLCEKIARQDNSKPVQE